MRTLANFKTAAGIGTTSAAEDAWLTAQIAIVFALMQVAVGRRFTLDDYVEEIVFPSSPVFLKEWPVAADALTATADGEVFDMTDCVVNRSSGIVYMRPRAECDVLVVNYRGGYTKLPADLELVIDGVVGAAWGTYQTTGSFSGISTTTASSDESVKSINVPDVVRVEFEPSSSAATTSAASATSSSSDAYPDADPLAPYGLILDRYRDRHHRMVGIRNAS